MNELKLGDAIEVLKTLPSESVQTCITSPPYYGLRDYGEINQIGLEQSPSEYIDRLLKVFDEVFRVLKKDGTLWVNIGDSYAGSGKGPLTNKSKNTGYEKGSGVYKVPKKWDGIKPKDMIGIPWMLAFALRDRGWYLRSDIIWHKTNSLPESVKDRPTKSYEHIFLFAKSRKYYFDYKSIREPLQATSLERYKRGRSGEDKYSNSQGIMRVRDGFKDLDSEYRHKRDVWSVSTNTFKMDEHFAIFPEKLIEPCVKAGSRQGDTVLDPFLGSGTTGVVAKRFGRQFIGIELNPIYVKLAKKRLDETVFEG